MAVQYLQDKITTTDGLLKINTNAKNTHFIVCTVAFIIMF
jgi:hypothetical protein